VILGSRPAALPAPLRTRSPRAASYRATSRRQTTSRKRDELSPTAGSSHVTWSDQGEQTARFVRRTAPALHADGHALPSHVSSAKRRHGSVTNCPQVPRRATSADQAVFEVSSYFDPPGGEQTPRGPHGSRRLRRSGERARAQRRRMSFARARRQRLTGAL